MGREGARRRHALTTVGVASLMLVVAVDTPRAQGVDPSKANRAPAGAGAQPADPGGPGGGKPADPGKPGDPGSGKPANPGGKPANPANPANPGSGKPANPGGKPADPGSGKPANPGGKPADPGSGKPANPGSKPANPGSGKPANPGGKPANPGSGKPANPGSQPANPGSGPANPGNPGGGRPENPGSGKPGTIPGDRGTVPADPGVTSGDPAGTSGDPVKLPARSEGPRETSGNADGRHTGLTEVIASLDPLGAGERRPTAATDPSARRLVLLRVMPRMVSTLAVAGTYSTPGRAPAALPRISGGFPDAIRHTSWRKRRTVDRTGGWNESGYLPATGGAALLAALFAVFSSGMVGFPRLS